MNPHTLSVLNNVHNISSTSQLPITIDYPAALALRQMALVQDELPKYLLAPEVSALLHYVPDLHRKMLLATLSDTQYVSQLQMMIATLKIPQERRNKRSGKIEKARIWSVTDRTVRTWFNEAVDAAAADGGTFSVPVTPAYVTALLPCTCCTPVFR